MSNRERQTMEFEVMESIFGADVEDLRTDPAKPLNFRIALTPLQGSYGPSEIYVRISLRVICSSKYPKVPPKVSLELAKGLSDALIEDLQKQLTEQTEELKGQEMIYELAQSVQAFLHKHNRPPSGSFYEEMLLQRNIRDQEQKTCQEMRQSLEQKAIQDEIEKRKEMLKKEKRIRRDTRSISESSPKHGSTSMDISQESLGWSLRGHTGASECLEHRHSEKIYFTQAGRQVQRGCCLNHSQKGCVAFSGVDLETGQLLYITEWMIRYDELERQCQVHCKSNSGSEGRCAQHSVDEVIAYIEKQVQLLSQLRHKNLINYECCMCMKKKEGILVYLVQDFVLGTSIYSISGTLGWCLEGVVMVAKGVLNAIVFLHNNSVFHNSVLDTTTFMDTTGTIRVSDFCLVPYLQELIGAAPKRCTNDLPAMGSLIESLLPSHPNDMRDYIDHCKSDRTLTAVELVNHPFLQPALYQSTISTNHNNNIEKTGPEAKSKYLVEPRKSIAADNRSVVPVQSRLENEFEFIQFLGRGAYGDVLKVRNILDNRQYAIKRIQLKAKNKQLYKKIRREVELLSRLNHENVVRYYNSWIEIGLPNADFGQEEISTGEFSCSADVVDSSKGGGDDDDEEDDDDDDDEDDDEEGESSTDDDESSDCDWINCIPPAAAAATTAPDPESSDDGIEFVNSDGECAVYSGGDGESRGSLRKGTSGLEKTSRRLRSPRVDNQFMYIQMEFCEKSTLRSAIDNDLHKDPDRLWRLLREITEGLAHIHQQGMIHRDLKPVNIFLDSRDQVKIGDFGLATTSFLALQAQEHNNTSSSHNDPGDTLTGHVGTTLYVAPELTGNASKSTYNNKVDLYSLGVIFFEMYMGPFSTGMERVTTIQAVRTPEIQFPCNGSPNNRDGRYAKVVQWLLNHDPCKRPSAEELLASDLIPPARLEATELQEMLRNVLQNPQSKTYKNLVARCLSQHNDDRVLASTYYDGMAVQSSCLEYVKNRVVDLLRLHGGREVTTPLLCPVESLHAHRNSVKLMTHSGCVVYLPYDFRMPLARQVVLDGTQNLRRYSVGRVFREKRTFDIHPKQFHECAFDIIGQGNNHLLGDAEVLAIAHRITTEFPELRSRNCVFRLNHPSLLSAILMQCHVTKDRANALYQIMGEFMENRITKFQMTSAINSLLGNKANASTLIELLLTESPLGVKKSNVTGNAMRTLLKGRGEAAALANGAFREMEHVVALAQQMGVSSPIVLHAGISVLLDRTRSGVVWQLVADLKSSKRRKSDILAMGGRYNELLSSLQNTASLSSGKLPPTAPEKTLCGVGFSFALDKLVTALGGANWDGGDQLKTIEVLLCVTGTRPPTHIVTEIMRMLWSLKIRSGVLEVTALHEAEAAAKDLGARHVIILRDDGSLRVSAWDNRIFNYHQMSRTELNEFFKRLKSYESGDALVSGGRDLSNAGNYTYSAMTGGTVPTYFGGGVGVSATSNNGGNGSACVHCGGAGGSSGSGRDVGAFGSSGNGSASIQNVEVVFSVNEKLLSHVRRRIQNQIMQQMNGTLNLFNPKAVRVKVYAMEISSPAVGAFVGAVDARDIVKNGGGSGGGVTAAGVGDEELVHVIDRFPRLKKLFMATYDDIVDDLRLVGSSGLWTVIGVYSITDNCYRVIV